MLHQFDQVNEERKTELLQVHQRVVKSLVVHTGRLTIYGLF